MKRKIVVAFGGNALLKSGQTGTIDEQEANVYETCSTLVPLIQEGYSIILTHGNGPQVGNVLLRQEAGKKIHKLPVMPIDICVAETQGFIGYMIEQQMRNVLEKHNLDKDILTIVTQVIVDKNDEAFKKPSKPIGPYYAKNEVEKLKEENQDNQYQEDSRGRGWRRVVASPKPIRINNIKSIERLADNGAIVVTCGGGGIPAFYVEPNKLQGIDAVIDKDLVSSMLAAQVNADKFMILTDISKVYLHFNTPKQKAIDQMNLSEARKYLEEGHFASGSMGPKIKGAIHFIENGGKEVLITEAKNIGNPKEGTKITLH